MKIIQCWWQWSAAPFSPSGLQKARNAEKVKIENRRWSYFFSKLDPMLFGVFGPKLAKESPCGHQLVNSKIFHFCQITTPRYSRLQEWPCESHIMLLTMLTDQSHIQHHPLIYEADFWMDFSDVLPRALFWCVNIVTQFAIKLSYFHSHSVCSFMLVEICTFSEDFHMYHISL